MLSQVASLTEDIVWITLDEENDIFSFLNLVGKAIRQTFSGFDFSVSEYLPYEQADNYRTILTNALIGSIEKLEKDFMLVLEDLHTIADEQTHKFIAGFMKYLPKNIRLCISSREHPWPVLIPMQIKGNLLEITQKELAFKKDEVTQVLGFDDGNLFDITEGWPLAIRSYKVLLENGVSLEDLPARGHEALYAYLFFECISRLSHETVAFLKASACFDELDSTMLDVLLEKKNTKLILESLVARNLFVIQTEGGNYRYHTLFRDYLIESSGRSEVMALRGKAADYYFDQKHYYKAAQYAICLKHMEMLEQIILVCYREEIRNGRFNELRVWFSAYGELENRPSRELLVAKGAFLSSIGNFTEAKACLDAAIPLLEQDQPLYVEAMLHKARVLRNDVSFEASNRLLDDLIAGLRDHASETAYSVVIEKIYNLCWNSQIDEAYALAYQSIETCAKAGHLKVKAWFERYLSVIHYLAGRMKEAVFFYEKSLELPETDRRYLELHSIELSVAKAYQMLGKREIAVSMIAAELQKLRSAGRYEELWIGYLFAAEIHYQNTFIDRMNGGNQDFEATKRYFALAEEYASLYRKTEIQVQWTRMQRLTYSLMFTNEPKEPIIQEIYANLGGVGDYFKTIALARLFGYFGTVSDFPNAVQCARRAIEIGEKANLMLIPTMAYGILARAAIAQGDDRQSVQIIRRFLQLCASNGTYEYFNMRRAYDPILKFAYDHQIEPEFTKQMMAFVGYALKKIYVQTLGSFAVFLYQDRPDALKMRTKKERELFAYLLATGEEGATKEQIYYAIWSESDSADVKKLIGVHLAQLKRDLERFGLRAPIVKRNSRYSVRRDEIALDLDLFEAAAAEFEQRKNKDTAEQLLSLYKGEYLADFEALWSISKKIRYQELYTAALTHLKNQIFPQA